MAENDILSEVVRLESQLGHVPTLLDILSRLNRVEIDLVWESLISLYPDSLVSLYSK
jgi:hypothetical protein